MYFQTLFPFPVHYNNYKRIVCSHSIKPVPRTSHDFMYIYVEIQKWFVIIINAFNIKYLILKSLIRQKLSTLKILLQPGLLLILLNQIRTSLQCWLIHLFHGRQHVHKTVTCLYINIGTNIQRKNIHPRPKCSSLSITKSLDNIWVQSLNCCKLVQLSWFQ